MTESSLPPAVAALRREMDKARYSLRRLKVTPRAVHRLSPAARRLKEIELRVLALECHVGMLAEVIERMIPDHRDPAASP